MDALKIIEQKFKEAQGQKALIIGVGNEFRNDDRVGLELIRHLNKLKSFKLCESSGEALDLMEAWEGFDQVFLIDAVEAKGEPGKISCFSAHEKKLPTSFFSCSSHFFSVAEGIEMARALNRMPQNLTVIGIEGKNFDHGQILSQEVIAAQDKVLKRIYSVEGDLQ